MKLAGLVAGLQVQGLSHRAIVAKLNSVGVPAPRGGERSLPKLQRLLRRLDNLVVKAKIPMQEFGESFLRHGFWSMSTILTDG